MSIIWMHGLGDTPAGWSDLEQNIPKLLEAADIELETPIVFKFPAAPKAPVTINKGAESNSWFDLVDFPCTPDSKDDVKGITASLKRIHALIDSVAETVEHSKIIVGGFSQGAALALQAVYTYPKKLAGCVCLSGWLQMRDQFPKAATAANKKTRCFWGHGFMDNIVLPENQKVGSKVMTDLGIPVECKSYPIPHSSHPNEIREVAQFVAEVLEL